MTRNPATLARWWVDQPLQKKGLIVIAIPLLMLLVIVPTLIIMQWQIRDAQARITHTLQVSQQIDRVLTLQIDAERSIRGYLLTNDARFLEPYNQAQTDLPRAIQDLTTLVEDNPAQVERARQVQQLVTTEMAILAAFQETGNRGNTFTAEQLQTSKVQMDALRGQVAAMNAEEERLLRERNADVQRLTTFTQWFDGLTILLALAGGIVATVLFTRGVVLRIQHLGVVAQQLGVGQPPDAPVAEADEIGALGREIFNAGQLLSAREAALHEAASALERRVEERTVALHQQLQARQQAEEALQGVNEQLTALVGRLEQQAHDIAMLNELGDYLQACRSPEEAATVIRRLGAQLFHGSSGFVGVFRASQNLVEPLAAWGDEAGGFADFAPDQCWALRRGRPHAVGDDTADLPCGHAPAVPASGYQCLPLMADGEMLGILHLRGLAAGDTNELVARQRLATAVAERIGLALATLQMQVRLRDQSIRDPLTGLYNRRYLEESLDRELQRAERQGQPLSVIMLDLDHFKRFNDTFGHQAGDALLREVGRYLTTHIRDDDFACRYGGEELTLILPGATLATAEARAEELRLGLRDLTILHQRRVLGPITASIGVATFSQHGDTAEALLRAADSSLYRAKRDGRDRIALAS